MPAPRLRARTWTHHPSSRKLGFVAHFGGGLGLRSVDQRPLFQSASPRIACPAIASIVSSHLLGDASAPCDDDE